MLQGRNRGPPAMADSELESSPPPDAARKPKSNSFFSLPGLFVGFTKGAAPDSDPSRSPTSPLDCKVFSGLGSYLTRSPRSPHCDRVALGLVDALYDDGNAGNLRVLSSATSPRSLPKNCLMKSQARVGPSSADMAPENPGARFLELGRPVKVQPCSMDRSFLARQDPNFEVLHPESKDARLVSSTTAHGSLPITTRFVASLSASDIEQSEDYTCIISRGPNPKTTHIFGDCILETHPGDLFDLSTNKLEKVRRGTSWVVTCTEEPVPSFTSEDFLRVCYSCKKKLEGKDIYMYRGEKAFCSSGCRSQAISVEEEIEEEEETATGSPPPVRSVSCEEEIFFPGMDVVVAV